MSETLSRIAALYEERQRIYDRCGRGVFFQIHDPRSRLPDIGAALESLWAKERQARALRRAGGRPRCLGAREDRY